MNENTTISQEKRPLNSQNPKLRTAGIFGITGAIAFLIFSTLNMLIYPGWYHINYVPYYTDHYSFIYNNLSAMEMLETFVGESNLVSAGLFTFTLTITGICILFFVRYFPKIFALDSRSYKNARVGSILGIVSSLAFIGVGWTPWDVLLIPHMMFVFIAFLLAIAFNILFSIAILQDKEFPNWISFTMLSFALIVLSYLLTVALGPPYGTVEARIVESLGQKIVAYCQIVTLIINASGFLIVLKKK